MWSRVVALAKGKPTIHPLQMGPCQNRANAKLFLEPLEGIAGLSRPIFDGVDADIRVEHVFIQGICVISI